MGYHRRHPFACRINLSERKRRADALGGAWPEGWDLDSEDYG
ncbi:MAG: hypothetical protein Q8O86_09580 [Dehalococcoidia bacterium]|nr:hypothetical protein [Dehalococcoidia bacterium]